ncbi:MAG TPA: hypothetical protein VM687_17085 [Stenotrophomonas sp.]|nr:hypothetical protein [Stenotrophomonas sp.]
MRVGNSSRSSTLYPQQRSAAQGSVRLPRSANPGLSEQEQKQRINENWEQYQQRRYTEQTGNTGKPPEGYGETEAPAKSPWETTKDVLFSVVTGGPVGAGKPGAKPPTPAGTPPRSPTPPPVGGTPPRSPTPPPAGGTPPRSPTPPPGGQAPAPPTRPGTPPVLKPPAEPALPSGETGEGTVKPTDSPEGPSAPKQPRLEAAPPAEGKPSTSGEVSKTGPQAPPVEAVESMKDLIWPENWSSPAHRFVDRGGAFRDSYEQSFRALSEQERYAVRDWTHVEGSDETYRDPVDGHFLSDTNEYEGINYELNNYLRNPEPYDPEMEARSDELHNALAKLARPGEPVKLLRVADVGPGYADKFAVGDLVTNGRPFMSASSEKGYAEQTFKQGYAAEGRTGGLAIYEIQAKSATPMLEGITTLAGHEGEWIFTPNTVFEVTEKFTFTKKTESNPSLEVTAIRLKEVTPSKTEEVKNIHTSATLRIGPEEQKPPPSPGSSGSEYADDF